MFLFKKVFSQFFFPMPLVVGLSVAGLLFLWFTRRRHLGRLLTTSGVLLLCVISYPSCGNILISSLEYRFEPFPAGPTPSRIQGVSVDSIRYVVVLGGGQFVRDGIPVTSTLVPTTEVRLVEGIRIHRKLPRSRLVLSGGGRPGEVPHAEFLASVARELGVADSEIVLESKSRDTKDEARLLKPLLGTSPFVLVTSASHMPRAVALLKGCGLDPLPAPTAHTFLGRGRISHSVFFPSATNVRKVEDAVHEYLGLLWAKIRGQT